MRLVHFEIETKSTEYLRKNFYRPGQAVLRNYIQTAAGYQIDHQLACACSVDRRLLCSI